MKLKVLITDDAHPLLVESLTDMGYACEIDLDVRNRSLADVIQDYTGLIINSRIKIDKQLLEQAINLKFIGRLGSGMDNIDLAYAETKGIDCLNSPEGNKDAVAEHVLGMLLSMLNNIHTSDRMIRSKTWSREQHRGTELNGRALGVIGYGNTGSAFVKLLQGFDVDVYVYDKYLSGFGAGYIIESSLDEIFDHCSICSLHVPLTDETDKMVDKNFIDRFAQPFYLINSSRGKIVDTAALIVGLKGNKIIGAALDVLENEKIDNLSPEEENRFNALTDDKRVILTPHIAGWTTESKEKIAKILVGKIKAISKSNIGESTSFIDKN